MSLKLTTNAAKHMRRFANGCGKSLSIRLGVKTTGCSGLAYTMELDEKIQEGDKTFELDGIKILVDSKSIIYLDGTELDYKREGLQEGFQFNNPNAKETCGCGESFVV